MTLFLGSFSMLFSMALKTSICCILLWLASFYVFAYIRLSDHLYKECNMAFCFRPTKVPEIVKSMLGNKLTTKQTPKDGVRVSKVNFVDSVFWYAW